MAVNRLNVGATNQLLAKASTGQSTNILELQNTAGVTVAGVDANGNGVGGLAHPPTFKNLIINGAMQVAQRSSSVTGITATSINTADRWFAEFTSLGTWTQSVENDAPTGSGFRKSLKMLCTTADASPAAGDYALVQQKLEGQNLQQIAKGTSSAKQLTLSFWVKSNVTGTYNASLYDQDNSGRFQSKTYTISASATWEKKTITFDADTTGVLDNDNARSLDVDFWLGAGTNLTSGTANSPWGTTTTNLAPGQTNVAAATNNYWQITGVQLEVGSVATEFEFMPIDAELARCQRYFQRMGYDNESYTFYSVGSVQTTTNSIFIIPLITQMRTAPVVTFINPTNLAINDSTNNVAVSSASCIRPTVFNLGEVSVNVTGGTHTIGRGCRLLSNNQTNTQIQSSAEL
jgi:hypothetical protein